MITPTAVDGKRSSLCISTGMLDFAGAVVSVGINITPDQARKTVLALLPVLEQQGLSEVIIAANDRLDDLAGAAEEAETSGGCQCAACQEGA